MDAERFDTLLRSLSDTPSRRGALRLLAGSALGSLLTFGWVSTDAKKGGKGKSKGKGKKKSKQKVTICHSGQTIRVSQSAWKAHEKHGDSFGACATPNPPGPPPPPSGPPPPPSPPPPPLGPPPPPPGPICGALFASCDVNEECCSDICFPFSTPKMCGCAAFEQACEVNANCCSGTCTGNTCTCHEEGVICGTDADCCAQLRCQDRRSVGGILIGTCKPVPPFQGICTAEDDGCAATPTTRNCSSTTVSALDCVCVVTTSGASFCAENLTNPGECSNCTTDEECRQQTQNPNAVCTRGGPCSCSAEEPAFCSLPCANMA